jgi:hypothetical protein
MVRRPRDCSWLVGNAHFANLTANDFKCASDPDDDYNCIAWAVGKTDTPWWPTPYAPNFWPDGLPKYPEHVAERLENFIKVFEMQGYKLCRSRRFSRRYEKVAIFVSNNTGRATHAARTLSNGIWSSKMGWKDEDIEHRNLECIQGSSYGTVRAILKRKWQEDQKPKLKIFRWFPLSLLGRARGWFSPIPKANPTGN